MRRYSNELTLKEAIEQLLNAYGMKDKVNASRFINSWETVVGSMIKRHTLDLHVKRKTLYVKVDSAALRNELSYAKENLIKNLNKYAGANVITDIVFV